MTDATTNESDDRDLDLDPKLLDNYVGQYRFGEFAVLDITREGNQLFAQTSGDLRHQVTAESETEFAIRALGAQMRFITDGRSQASSLVTHQHGVRMECPRLDLSAAQAVLRRRDERIAANVPQPGSEAALRRLLDGIANGTPNYQEMSPLLAGALEQQLPQFQTIARYLGPVQEILFKGVGRHGWDVYEVRRANGTSQWRIVINANGGIENAAVHATDTRLYGAMFGAGGGEPAVTDGPLMSTSEAALRRFIDGIREGAPNVDEMVAGFAQAVRAQQQQMQVLGQRLGKIVAIEYCGAVTETYDIFEVQHERGTMRRRISLTPDGKIASVSAVLTGTGLAAGP